MAQNLKQPMEAQHVEVSKVMNKKSIKNSDAKNVTLGTRGITNEKRRVGPSGKRKSILERIKEEKGLNEIIIGLNLDER